RANVFAGGVVRPFPRLAAQGLSGAAGSGSPAVPADWPVVSWPVCQRGADDTRRARLAQRPCEGREKCTSRPACAPVRDGIEHLARLCRLATPGAPAALASPAE